MKKIRLFLICIVGIISGLVVGYLSDSFWMGVLLSGHFTTLLFVLFYDDHKIGLVSWKEWEL